MGVGTVMSFPSRENHTQLGNLIRTGQGPTPPSCQEEDETDQTEPINRSTFPRSPGTLTIVHKQLNAWHERWKEFIAERTYARDDPSNPKASRHRWWWTHEELRRCYRRLEKLFREGMLFAFLEPGLLAGRPVARTTNLLEGGINSLIKRTLLEHHGLPEDHMRRACEWRCYMKSAWPEPNKLIITAFEQPGGTGLRQDDDRHGNGYDNGIQANNHDDPTNEPGFYIRKGHVH